MSGSAPWLSSTLVVGLLGLSACGGALPQESGPAGVDGLVVPTPSADPDDFVDGVDNPWLPLSQGSVWRYRSEPDGPTVTVTVSGTREVGGVPTTVVEEVVTGPDGDVVVESVSSFAQDVEGNVWAFGEDRTAYDERDRPDPDESFHWRAGVDGAQAGIAMLADPRVGDGYRQGYADAVPVGRATVLSVDAEVEVGAQALTDLLLTEHVSSLEALAVHRYFERGTGLVAEQPVSGGAALELVAHDPG